MYNKTHFKASEKADALFVIEGGAEIQDKTRLAAVLKAIYYSAPQYIRIEWGKGSFYAIPTKKGLEWAEHTF